MRESPLGIWALNSGSQEFAHVSREMHTFDPRVIITNLFAAQAGGLGQETLCQETGLDYAQASQIRNRTLKNTWFFDNLRPCEPKLCDGL